MNPISHLAYAASGSDVKHSIIDGKLVMFDRKLLTINEREVIEEAEKAAWDVYNRTGICKNPETVWPIL